MASIFSHAAVAISVGTAFHRKGDGLRFWLLGTLCAAIPDLDVVGLGFGIPYGSPLGHRGFTHSLLFAALLAGSLVITAFRRHTEKARLWTYLFLATALHGVLDAMTTGGKGVGFFIPLTDTRYFLPLRPIRVSPIGIGAFFSARGLAVISNELAWIWAPSATFAMAVMFFRRKRSKAAPEG